MRLVATSVARAISKDSISYKLKGTQRQRPLSQKKGNQLYGSFVRAGFLFYKYFIAKVSKTWNKSRDVYSVVGDVLNPIAHSKEFRTFTLIYGAGKEKKNIQIKVDKHTKCERLDCDSLRDARVKVIGKMNIYSQKSEININALRIELLGISSRLQEYEKNK